MTRMDERKSISIYTDGGCDPNPGPGGWAAILQYGKHTREITGAEAATTNNRMELSAALGALNALKEPCIVTIFTDSQYLRRGITEWLPIWKRKSWKTAAKTPVKNEDLWRALDIAISQHKIHWKWVKGHSGNRMNERCDQLATKAIHNLRAKHSPAELRAALHAWNQKQAHESAAETLW